MASASWERRNAIARSKGFRDYYDYRIHNYGRIPARLPPVGGAERSRLRGHRSRSDLVKQLPRATAVTPVFTSRDPSTGQVTRMILVVTGEDGVDREFTLGPRELDKRTLQRIADLLAAAGVPVFGAYADVFEPYESEEGAEAA